MSPAPLRPPARRARRIAPARAPGTWLAARSSSLLAACASGVDAPRVDEWRTASPTVLLGIRIGAPTPSHASMQRQALMRRGCATIVGSWAQPNRKPARLHGPDRHDR